MTTTDGEHPTLSFQTGDTNIEQDDLLGFIGFQAPDEGTGDAHNWLHWYMRKCRVTLVQQVMQHHYNLELVIVRQHQLR